MPEVFASHSQQGFATQCVKGSDGKTECRAQKYQGSEGVFEEKVTGGSLASSMTLMEPARVELSGDVTSRPDQMINDDSRSKLRPMKKTHSAWRIKLTTWRGDIVIGSSRH